MSGLGRLLPVAAKPLKARADRTASLVGPLCTPGDVLGREVNVPEVGVGDIIAIPNTGAYGVTASLTSFLSRTPPVEVVVRNGDVVSVSRLDQRRVTSL
jgi:diaminopimelate decarboxylase